MPAPTAYRRHDPERTALHRAVELGLLRLESTLASGEVNLPAFVAREFRDYLACGRREHGFLRVKCDGCRQEHLVDHVIADVRRCRRPSRDWERNARSWNREFDAAFAQVLDADQTERYRNLPDGSRGLDPAAVLTSLEVDVDTFEAFTGRRD